MARNKVKLAWIVNDVARKSSFTKRRTCLLKKMSEITTLCDVGAFLILYSPDSDELTLWPDRDVVEQLLAKFQSIPELERWKKMMNQENYLKERAAKMEKQIRKITKQNNDLNINEVLYQVVQKGKPLSSFETEDLTSLVLSMEDRMKDIQKRIDYLEENNDPNHPPCVTPQEERDGQFENMSQSEGNFAESLFWYKYLGNRIENPHGLGSSVRSDIGIPLNTCFGSSSIAANDIEFPNPNVEAKNTYTGSYKMMPQMDFGGITSGYDDGTTIMGHLPNQGNVGENVAGRDAGLPTGRSGGQ